MDTKRFEYHECIFRGETREMILFKKSLYFLIYINDITCIDIKYELVYELEIINYTNIA